MDDGLICTLRKGKISNDIYYKEYKHPYLHSVFVVLKLKTSNA